MAWVFTNATQRVPVFTIAVRYLYFYRDSLPFHLMSKHTSTWHCRVAVQFYDSGDH